MLKNQKGITLVALVITVIVLLILAACTLTMVIGPGGVLSEAQNVKSETTISEIHDYLGDAINAVNMEFTENGYPAQAIDETEITDDNEIALSRAVYILNDINNDSGKIKSSLISGYEITGASVSGVEVTIQLTVDGTEYTAIYDAQEQDLSIE